MLLNFYYNSLTNKYEKQMVVRIYGLKKQTVCMKQKIKGINNKCIVKRNK